jgi:CBS domain-containing protein
MGFLSTAAGFGAGYVVGARKGFGPLEGVLGRRPAVSTGDRDRPPPGAPDRDERAAAAPIDDREVRQLMTAAPQSVPLTATIATAARIMRDADIGDVVVVEEGSDRIVGIVTDRDVAVRGVGAGHDPARTSVREISSTDPATVRPDDSVRQVARVMRRHDVRRLPVVEDGVAIGVISLGDIAGSEESVAVLDDVSAAPPNG